MSDADQLAEEIAWVRAMAAGDQSALGSLYDRYAPILMGIGLRIVRDRQEVEDIVHDVFVEAWKSARDFDPSRGKVRTWLAVRMRSRCLDRQKSARVRLSRGDEALTFVAEESDGMGSEARRDAKKVIAALGQLGHEQRAVLVLAYQHGLTCQEIAEHEGIPIGTVKSRLAAGMDKLRRMFLPSPSDLVEVT